MSGEAVKLEEALKRLPWWGWAAGGGVLLGGVYYVRKHGATGAQGVPAGAVQATPEYQAPDGLSSADLAGLPFDYYDWSASAVPGVNQSGVTASGSTTPGAPSGTPTAQPLLTPGGAPQAGVTSGYAPGNSIVMGASQPGGSPTPTPGPTPPAGQTQTVEPWPAWDSTLSGIGAHYGVGWQQLYHMGNNQSVIDDMAHSHGHYGDEYNWLFPGEVLQVP